MSTFTLNEQDFLLDEQPFRVLSGAMHYFRIPPQYWDDRLNKLRQMGLNTVETYVAWNLHERRPGAFDFGDGLDLVRYIELAAAHNLKVIVRPGPYICSEWDFGGLPAWLLRDPGLRVRCMYPPYLQAVDRYFDALLPRLVPLQITHGGPVIAVQVENEYGSYGNDRTYLRHLADGLRARGIDCLLFTSDGEAGALLQSGTLPEILKTVNFAIQPERAFTALRRFQPIGPLMCCEYWCGWFDHWGEPRYTRLAEETATTLDVMLAAGASVNLYMFHGGTNFGFMNGANFEAGRYQPDVTSYDYDAPLSEAGDLTPKYHAFRRVIGKYTALPDLVLPEPPGRLALVSLTLNERAGLFESLAALSTPVESATPEPMEAFGQDYGFILYRTVIPGPRPEAQLTIRGLHDRAQVFAGEQSLGILERGKPVPASGQSNGLLAEADDACSLSLSVPGESLQIDILVENMGRINFGPELVDRKGITGGVLFGQQYLFGWTVYPLPLAVLSSADGLTRLQFRPVVNSAGPAFFRGRFQLDQTADTFLALPGWTKGVVWINGFNLGRYWNIGPQQTLYLPAPLLRAGENELVIFELHDASGRQVELRAEPDLGPTA